MHDSQVKKIKEISKRLNICTDSLFEIVNELEDAVMHYNMAKSDVNECFELKNYAQTLRYVSNDIDSFVERMERYNE